MVLGQAILTTPYLRMLSLAAKIIFSFYKEEKNMSTTYMSKLTLPVNVEGTITNVEFTIKDQEARDLILGLGKALYWA